MAAARQATIVLAVVKACTTYAANGLESPTLTGVAAFPAHQDRAVSRGEEGRSDVKRLLFKEHRWALDGIADGPTHAR